MTKTAQPPDGAVNILIVEDGPTQARHLQRILEQQGYHVTATANGRDALEVARRRKPTVIISDAVMPESRVRRLSAAGPCLRRPGGPSHGP